MEVEEEDEEFSGAVDEEELPCGCSFSSSFCFMNGLFASLSRSTSRRRLYVKVCFPGLLISIVVDVVIPAQAGISSVDDGMQLGSMVYSMYTNSSIERGSG